MLIRRTLGNSYFKFKRFVVEQERNAMKVTTDACVFGALADFSDREKILDIGAGTGILTLMIAQRFDKPVFTSVEIDKSSFEELKSNCALSPWSERVSCVNADIRVLANYKNLESSFDGIISNPPFYKSDLKSPESTINRVKHEDISLSMKALFQVVLRLLRDDGIFYCIYPIARLSEIKEQVREFDMSIVSLTFIKDNANKSPKLFIAEISKTQNENRVEKEFFVKSGNEYSQEMKKIMSPFYLDL